MPPLILLKPRISLSMCFSWRGVAVERYALTGYLWLILWLQMMLKIDPTRFMSMERLAVARTWTPPNYGSLNGGHCTPRLLEQARGIRWRGFQHYKCLQLHMDFCHVLWGLVYLTRHPKCKGPYHTMHRFIHQGMEVKLQRQN